jgi:aminoglycoside/choline kinase family phosphotransferase
MGASELITSTKDERLEQAENWLQSLDADLQTGLIGIAGDASFRRYFRAKINGQSRILMDAPPPGEDVRPFIDIARRLIAANLHAPEIYYADQQNGYLLLEDLGDDLYKGLLDGSAVGTHFSSLFEVLKNMALDVNTNGLRDYSTGMLQAEMDLFPDWYLGSHRSTMPRGHFDSVWSDFCQQIIASAVDQPRCFVHRDYHSSNLLKMDDNQVGIIDFQDAVNGPISYDFISLIWDRHIEWPRNRIERWMEDFRQLLGRDFCQRVGPEQWRRYCDLMGLQRNFKIVGIFARLYYRDSKNGYIEMIPRFYKYIISTLRLYPEFVGILNIMEQNSCEP